MMLSRLVEVGPFLATVAIPPHVRFQGSAGFRGRRDAHFTSAQGVLIARVAASPFRLSARTARQRALRQVLVLGVCSLRRLEFVLC
jgi:hypothetical protein